jgi:hypothetical protein
MAFHVVKVYVMCVCRGNMWAVKALVKKRARGRRRGRNGFDEHQDIKQ